MDALIRHGAAEKDISVHWVPGSFELPFVAQEVAVSGAADAIVCLGAVIRGETTHYDLVADGAARGVARVSLEHRVPCGFGVLTTETLEQAMERAGGKHGNKGADAAPRGRRGRAAGEADTRGDEGSARCVPGSLGLTVRAAQVAERATTR